MKSFLVHDCPLAKQRSTKIVIFMSSTFEFLNVFVDVTQGYLQSDATLHQKVYLIPPPEMNLEEKLLELQKPLHGLSESGKYWRRPFRKHLREDSKMTSATSDPVQFYPHLHG